MDGMRGTVFFIGAGPGDPELITVKGRRIIDAAELVLYAGSLVPRAVVEGAKPGAAVLDSSGMTLEETHALTREAVLAGKTVARVHTGDPSLYGAAREQMALLDAEDIPYQIVPGVTAAFAAAAAGRVSLTVPESVQSFSVTRLGGRTDVPQSQSVRELARHGGSLAIYLSAPDAARLECELLAGGVDPKTPVLVAYRVGWPEERLVRTEVASLAATVAAEKFTRQTVFLVLPGERDGGGNKEGPPVSRLYAGDFFHGFRKRPEEEGDA
jgi:precorrin-4/cobalt-precorrin-4 C11-methyltransferase